MDDLKDGHVGAPVSCSRIKLVSWEEGNYRVTDNPPSGEVWIGGPCVASGYFKNPEQTAEDFTEQNGIRWIYTVYIISIIDSNITKIYTITFVCRRFFLHGDCSLFNCYIFLDGSSQEILV